MEWRTIPGVEDYEINRLGKIRRRDTKYVRVPTGSSIQLYRGRAATSIPVKTLVARAFEQPEVPAAEPESDLVAKIDELARLRARVAELEAELARKSKVSPPAANKPASAVAATPAPESRQTRQTHQTKPGQAKKRYCVVCGRELPSGFWRRCPEHAFRDGVHTEDDFSGSVAL